MNAEYFAVLKFGIDADGENYVAVELGAGHGTWSVRAGLAARKRSIKNIYLVAAEAATSHFGFLKEHFQANGFRPEEHTLVQCVIGATDGRAYFPELRDPAIDWGARAISETTYADLGGDKATDRLGQKYSAVPQLSIASLIRMFHKIDLLHIDIQGHEFDAVLGSFAAINEKVCLMFIGTHSYEIDAELIKLLTFHGWNSCIYSQKISGATHGGD